MANPHVAKSGQQHQCCCADGPVTFEDKRKEGEEPKGINDRAEFASLYMSNQYPQPHYPISNRLSWL
jgi:hypothetical protein